MNWKRYWRRKQRDEELAEEIEAYLAHEIDENLERGMTREHARAAALRKFGNRTAIREKIHEMNSLRRLESIWRDLCYGARTLRSNPVFTLIAVLSLALGIGANAALFQLLDALVLRSLPVPNPQQLVRIQLDGHPSRTGQFGPAPSDFTYPQWQLIRGSHGPFRDIAAWASTSFNLAPTGQVRYINGIYASGSFFHTLGVHALIGRVFTARDNRPGCEAGAVIGYSFWQREFGGDRSALGRMLTLNSHPVPIVGITPPEFTGIDVGKRFDIALPLCAEPVVGWNGFNNVLENRGGLVARHRRTPQTGSFCQTGKSLGRVDLAGRAEGHH